MTEARRVSMETNNCTICFIIAQKRYMICDNCYNHFRPCNEQPSDLIRKKEVVDKMWVQKFMSHAREDRRAIILIVTSDRDFSYAMRNLVCDGYMILSVVGYENATVAKLSFAYASWLWREMELGNGCLRSHRRAR